MNTFHWILLALLAVAVLKLVQWLLQQRRPPSRICTACGFQGAPTQHTRGSFLIEVVLWLAFILPGLIYSLWRLSSRQLVCPQCQAPNMIPLDSPRGRQLARETSQQPPA